MPFRCSSGAAHPPPPRPLPCLHSSSLQFHAYIVSFTPAQSSLARLGPLVPPPEINVLIWNISERRLEPRACQSRAFCPLPGASAMVGGLGEGKGGQCRAETSRGPGRPPARTAPRFHLLLTKINVPLRCPKAPGRLHGIHAVSFPSPLKQPAPRGKEGQQPSFPTAAVSPGGEVPGRRPAQHREVASGPLLRRCSGRDEAGGRARFGG